MIFFFYCTTSLEKLNRPSHKIFTEFLLNVKYYIKGTIGYRKVTSLEHNHIQVMETTFTKFLNIQKQIKTVPSKWSELWHDFPFSLSCTGEGNGNPLQCSCLENPRHGGAWWAAVYGVTQSRTRLNDLAIAMTWMEKEMATHSSILAWRILWTEEPGRL